MKTQIVFFLIINYFIYSSSATTCIPNNQGIEEIVDVSWYDFNHMWTKASLVLHILTMDRVSSVMRLINSLEKANYSKNTRTDLVVHVDRMPNTNEAHHVLITLLKNLVWTHGKKTIKLWSENVGLSGQWHDAWQPENEPDDETAVNIILEDDLEVSHDYAAYFLKAAEHFKNDPSVASITGQKPTLRAKGDTWLMDDVIPLIQPLPKVIKYRLQATWSHAPVRHHWIEYRKWYKQQRKDGKEPVLVPNIRPNDWYLGSGKSDRSMWEMYLLEYYEKHNLYAVYAWANINGVIHTIVANNREKGLHYDGTAQGLDAPLCPMPWLDFPSVTKIPCLDWAGYQQNC